MKVIDKIANSNVVSANVELPYSANVYIVDQSNFDLMQQGATFSYTGGFYETTPVNLRAAATPGQKMYLIVDNPNGGSFTFNYAFNG